jgi:hypothetical protein
MTLKKTKKSVLRLQDEVDNIKSAASLESLEQKKPAPTKPTVAVKKKRRAPVALSDEAQKKLAEWEMKQAYEDAKIEDWLNELTKAHNSYSAAQNEYRKSRYEALANAYKIYRTVEEEDFADTFYREVAKRLKDAGVKVQGNTPSTSLLIRFIWDDLSTSNVFKYGSVLRVAKERDVAVEDFAAWIKSLTMTKAVELSHAQIEAEESYKDRLNRARALIFRVFEIREVKPYAILPMLHTHKAASMIGPSHGLCIMVGSAHRRMDRESDYADILINTVLPPNLDLEMLIVDRYARHIVSDVDQYTDELDEKERFLWASDMEERLWQAEIDEAEKVREYWANRNQAALYEDQQAFAKAVKARKATKSKSSKK